MARIRTIKPEFWSSPDVGDVTRDARLTFIGLWNEADDSGRLEAVPAQVRATVFPYDDDVTVEMVCGWLNELIRQGLVRLYAAGRRAYLQITGWDDHQKISHPSQPRCPDPDDCRELDAITPTIQRDLGRTSIDTPASLGMVSGDPLEGVGRPSAPERRSVGPSERRTVGEEPSSPDGDADAARKQAEQEARATAKAEATERFERHFWPTYPKMPNGTKPEKGKALQQWLKLTHDQQQRAFRGARNLAEAVADDQTIPKHAHRFLRQSAGEFPFDDWQAPPTTGGRPPPPVTCPDCHVAIANHDDETCELVKAGKL